MDSENTAPPLLLEDVARAAAELNAEAELSGVVSRFHERLRQWSAPSAVLAVMKDPRAEGGWRLLPVLSFGSGPLGVERSIPQIVEAAPGCLERPTIVHPQEEVPGVKPRDNCIVPWAHEGDTGILVLRGVPRPSPANLGEAVAVLSAPVWPRLLGGPVPRIESLLADIRRAAETLGEDVERQLERLRASRPVSEGATGDDGEPTGASELEKQLEQVRQDGQQLQSERDALKERLLALETALKESEAERDQARTEVKKLSTRAEAQHTEHATEVAQLVERCRTAEAAARTAEEVRAASQRELDEARAEMEHSTLDWDELKGRVAVLQEALQDAEAERDRVRDEAERLSARFESMQADQAAALDKVEKGRKTAEAAAQTAQDDLAALKSEMESLKKAAATEGGDPGERVSNLEERLKEALSERDRARAEVGQLSGRIESLESAHKTALDDLDEKRRGAVAETQMARNETAAAQKELEEAKKTASGETKDTADLEERLARLEAELKDARGERDRAREESKRAAGELEDAMAELKSAQDDLTRARQDLGAAAASRHIGDIAREPAEAATAEGGARALETLRSTLAVLKRTPFVAPGLRVSIEEGDALVTGKDEGIEKWLRVAILDRDAASLEPLADELEAAGLDVRVANYPEELALLMKTPDARELGAVVCDILAFRPDQTVAGLFRGWEKDRPGLAFFLAFSSDDPAEAERASRVPQSLTMGRLSRPIVGAELVEKLQVMVKRQNASRS